LTNSLLKPFATFYDTRVFGCAKRNKYCASYEVQFEFVKQPLYSLTLFGLFKTSFLLKKKKKEKKVAQASLRTEQSMEEKKKKNQRFSE